MVTDVHEEDVSSHKVGSHRRVYGGLRSRHTGRVSPYLENMERI